MSAIDVLVVTALKEERDDFRAAAEAMAASGLGVRSWKEESVGPTQGCLFGETTGKRPLKICLARPTRMGATAASPVASSLVTLLQPYCLAMTGVCAGNPVDVMLGDVIIAEMVYVYDEGKQKVDVFEADHRQYLMNDAWLYTAQELVWNDLPSFRAPTLEESRQWVLELLATGTDPLTHPAHGRYFSNFNWEKRLKKLEEDDLIRRQGVQLELTDHGREALDRLRVYQVGNPKRLPFQIKVGPIASGSAVVKDGETFPWLKETGVRTILGIEMETAAMAQVAHRLDVPRWVVAKGVMDHADSRKNDRYKSFAGRASAEVMLKFLSQVDFPARGSDTGESVVRPPGRLFQLPNALSDFVGRHDDVELLISQLREQKGGVSISALKGMGGIGKTSLAVRVAHEISAAYPDAQLFVDLRGVDLKGQQPMTTAEVMARIILDFHPATLKLPENEPELLAMYRSVLRDKHALIVLDNALNELQVKDLISGDGVGFIITSRNSLVLDEVTPLEVGLFTPELSATMLRSIIADKGTGDEITMIAALCGHLPLALRVAGDFLRLKVDWTASQYIDALTKERHRWDCLKIGSNPEKDVEVVLKLSSAQLVRDDVDLATRWHFLADWPSDFAIDAVAAAWDMEGDEVSIRSDLSQLLDRSLLMYDTKSCRYRMHDLMKPIAAGLFGGTIE